MCGFQTVGKLERVATLQIKIKFNHMKAIFLLVTIGLYLSCNEKKMAVPKSKTYGEIIKSNDTLFSFHIGQSEVGVPCGYVNQKGDTIIPIGKYSACFTDTFINFAIVYDNKNTERKLIAINQKEEIIFDAYFYDNGPDYMKEGLFRIERNGKIGYANEAGEIVIDAVYACADPFENNKARVALTCTLTKEGEYTRQQSESWFYIDHTGKRIE